MQSASAIQIPENISLLLFACSSPPVLLFCKKPFCAFAFHNSNYIISACPGMLVGRLFDLLLYFTAFLSAYPVKSLFYSFAAAYFFSPSINKCCLYTIPCACTLCIVQKSSPRLFFQFSDGIVVKFQLTGVFPASVYSAFAFTSGLSGR